MNILPNLFSLRFFLAITVVLFHIPITSYTIGLPFFNALPIFNKGLIAVNFFFSLSGFLIARNLYIEYQKNGTLNLLVFYQKRIRRLWPVYYLVILIGILLYHIVLPLIGIDHKINYNLFDLCMHYLFFIPNVFNANFKVGGILNITWSVGIEEQFYIFFPLLFLFFKKKIKGILFILLIIFLGFLIFYKDFYFYRSYFFYFILGGLLALFAEEGKLHFLRYKIINIIIILLFTLNFFTDFFTFYTNMTFHHIFNLIVSNLFIVSIAYFPLFKLDGLKINYFGQISYGIYLYHMIITSVYLYTIKFFKMDEMINGSILIIVNNVVVIAITLFISHLSYQYFEKLFYVKRN